MELVILNALLYIISFSFYWYKRRKIDVGFVIFSVYAAVSVACVFNYHSDPNVWSLQLWSFIYLFIIIMLFFRPLFFDSDMLYARLRVRNLWVLKIFASVYVITALIATYFSIDETVDNIQSGAWAVLRNELYNGDVQLYSNQLERLAKIFTGYLSPLAIVLLFYYLTLGNVKKIWLLILALAIITPIFITAINTASRGIIVNLAGSLVLCYIIFRRDISKEVKKIILVFSVSLLALFLIYSLAVTLSRFGEDDQSSSLLNYFGHSMLVFNYGLTDSINTYGCGKYFFDWFLPLLGISPLNLGTLGAHFNTGFYTFVGSLYIDFGPIATLLIAIVFAVLIGNRLKYKRQIDIADIYLFLCYANYLFMGVFVIGLGNSLFWLITFLIYGLFKIMN